MSKHAHPDMHINHPPLLRALSYFLWPVIHKSYEYVQLPRSQKHKALPLGTIPDIYSDEFQAHVRNIATPVLARTRTLPTQSVVHTTTPLRRATTYPPVNIPPLDTSPPFAHSRTTLRGNHTPMQVSTDSDPRIITSRALQTPTDITPLHSPDHSNASTFSDDDDDDTATPIAPRTSRTSQTPTDITPLNSPNHSNTSTFSDAVFPAA